MSDTLNLIPTAKKLSHSELQTDTLTERQSLLTCVSSSSPVQPNSTEELRMWLLVAFPASLSQSQESKQAQMMPEICGLQQPTLFAQSDLPAFSWKTYQDYCSSTTPKVFSLTLPKWGMWDAMGLYPLPTWEPDTEGNGCGLLESWPTPDANMGARGTQPEWKPVRDSGHTATYTINQAVRDSWPTPKCQDERAALTDRGKMNLGEEVHEISNTADGARLNPDWCEWLMGWPVSWTDIKPLAELNWRDWKTDPADTGEVPRVTDVKENRANRLKAIGNGQVCLCVVKAWELLS